MNRRGFLGTVAPLSLAGCLRLTEEETGEQGGGAAKNVAGAVDDGDETKTDTASAEQTTQDLPPAQLQGSFRQFGYDAQNTGYVPEVSGPTGRVEIVWRGPRTDGPPVVDEGDVYVGGRDGTLYALRDGTVRWKADIGGDTNAESSPVVTDDLVVMPGIDGYVRGFSKDGEQEWKSPRLFPEGAEHEPLIFSHPTVTENVFLTGGANGKITAINPNTGSVLWSQRAFGYANMPAVGNGLVFTAGGHPDHASEEVPGINALSLTDGGVEWTFGTGTMFNANSPTVVGDRLLVTSLEGTVYALDVADGSEVWRYEFGVEMEGVSPAVHDGTAFVGTKGEEFYALDAETGERRWSHSMTEQVKTSAVVTDERVYISDRSGEVRALDPSNGVPRWSLNVGHSTHTGFAVVEDGLVIGSEELGVAVVRQKQ
ncbi:PQQ-binding-like beta-propeller repeat protein [Haloarchaeobius sp. TZWWS8]|uniref:outer membrane protein assembly factor BamB family protein n=1 Tax=Haloarchaeobius sp. TZWWS8 TaxID=3446121 RepID=UPI003EBAB8CD